MKKLLLLLSFIYVARVDAQIITTVAGSSFVASGVATVVGLSNPSYVAFDAGGNLYIADAGYNCIRKINSSGMMTTFAGNGTAGHGGDGGQATTALLNSPQGITVDASGNLYIAEYNCVRKVNTLGIITTIAGNDTAGFRGDGGQATAAELNTIYGITIDGAGNLYVAANGRIRMINTSGIISTIAGNGTAGFSGDGGQATAAKLYNPAGITMDATGNLYIADQSNNRIRMINTSGIISTVAGNGTSGFTGDGGQATAAELSNPMGIIVDVIGNIYVGDAGNDRVRVISTSGIITTFAGNGTFGYSGDSGAATTAMLNSSDGLSYNLGVGIDNLGNLYIADTYNNAVRKVNTMGIISTVAGNDVGDGEQATSAELANAVGVSVDVSGNIYIADASNNRIRKINTSGIISTVAGNGFLGFVGAGGYSGDGGQATAAELSDPFSAAIDAAGNLFIADEGNNRIRQVNTNGVISTFAGNGTAGYSGDGGQASAAKLNEPLAVAFDAVGNIYISDTYNNRIRKVNSLGIITTIAGNGTQSYSGDGGQATAAALYYPKQITFDAAGNLYFADMYNHCIRKINTSGIISTVVGTNGSNGFWGDGGQATNAALNVPSGVAFDNSGNMYISDGANQRIRLVNTSGIISTIVGNGTVGLTGDGGQAINAELHDPSYIALDAAGYLYIADNQNNRIRKVSPILTSLAVNSATICSGSTTTLTASGATTYSWSPATGLSATTGSMVVANPTVTTIYTVSGTAGSAMGSVTTTVTVNPIPSLTLTGNAYTVCNGVQQTIGVSGASTYTWSPAATLNNANTANTTTNATTTTVYSVTGTGANGCTNLTPATVTVNINQLPTYTLAGNAYNICYGSSQTFTVSGASNYTWIPAATLDNNNVASPTASPTTTTVYSVTGTDANGCINLAPATVTLTVNSIPTLSVTSNSYTICAGSSQTITASGSSTYTWAPATTLSNPNIPNPVASPTATTIYTVTGTNNGCDASPLTVTVNVNTNPTINVNPGYSVCPAGSVTMCANGASTYTWTPSNYTGNCMVANAAANYTIQGTDVNGCTGITTTNVQVVGNPTVSISSTSSICTSTCVAFTSTITPSSAIINTYEWNFGDGGPIITVANPSCYYYSTPSTYTVTLTVTDMNGCTGIATNSIMVTSSPTISIAPLGSNSVICNGTAVTITPSGATSYTLIPGNLVGTSFTVSPLSNITYTISGIDYTTGCTNAAIDGAMAPIMVNQPPALTYTLVQDVAPHTWDLFYTTTGSTGPYTYNFNWGDGSSSNVAYPTHTYSVAGTYSICATVTDNFGCSSTYCQNDAVFRLGNNSTYSNMVYVNVKTGTPGALAYKKLLADSVTEFDIVFDAPIMRLSNPQILNSCFQPFSNVWFAKNDSLHKGKNYKKITNNGNNFQGLMREDTVAKKVYFIPYCDTTESLLYNFALQQGDTITYNFSNSYAGLMTSGVFTVDSVRIKHDYRTYYHKHFYLKNHSVNESTLEQIEGVGNVSHPLFLYYSFGYGILSICNTANFDNVVSCKWDNGHKIYYDSCAYNFALNSGCFNTTDTCNYYATCGGINQINNLETVSIYPNPAQNNFTVETNLSEKQILQLFDVNGRLVLTQIIIDKTTIDVSSFNAGVYSLNIISNEGVVTKKIIIVK